MQTDIVYSRRHQPNRKDNMDLDEYVWRNRITLGSISEKTKISVNTLSNIKTKKIVPKLDTAIKLHMFTNGEVTFEEMLPLETTDRIKKCMEE